MVAGKRRKENHKRRLLIYKSDVLGLMPQHRKNLKFRKAIAQKGSGGGEDMVGVNQDVVINKLLERGVIRRSERRGRYFVTDEGQAVTSKMAAK